MLERNKRRNKQFLGFAGGSPKEGEPREEEALPMFFRRSKMVSIFFDKENIDMNMLCFLLCI